MLTRGFTQIVSLGSFIGLAACVQSAPVVSAPAEPVRVLNAGQPFQMSDGALARKVADSVCGSKGVNTSIYDRFDAATGEWVYPEGCA